MEPGKTHRGDKVDQGQDDARDDVAEDRGGKERHQEHHGCRNQNRRHTAADKLRNQPDRDEVRKNDREFCDPVHAM